MITRCAIYTRKSSEEGLEMAFNSLDAQREAGVDYVKSQKHQGWIAVEARYDDGGYSGGSTDRPGLQKLLVDIQCGRVDVVLVYKVDRLSRSLTDFARLMQTFDEHKVSFVSVTQQFNTTTSMGRLTLNMLLSFAQFEREVAGERIRDKIAATKRKGVWVCGQPPLGYRLEGTGDQRGLRIVPAEAELVRDIYTGYIESGSLVNLAAALRKKGATTKRWQSSRGIWHGGKPLSSTFIYKTLTNPAYIGQIAHTRIGKTQLYPGLHEAIVDRALWDRVQARMAVVPREGMRRSTHTHLLGGKIRTFEGHAMSPSSVWRPKSKSDPSGPKQVIRYYVSQKALKQGYKTCPIRSVKAAVFDDLVRALVTHRLAEQGMSVGALEDPARDALVRGVLVTLTVATDRLIAVLDFSTLSSTIQKAGGGMLPQTTSFPAAALPFIGAMPLEVERDGARETVTIRLDFKALAGQRIIRSADGLLRSAGAVGEESSSRATLTHFIGLAFLWHHELRSKGATVEAIAKRHRCSASYVHRNLRLAHLGPAILRDALSQHPANPIHLADAFTLAATLCWRTQAQRRVGGLREI